MQHTTKPRGLNIIIVGCGKVGAALVQQLSREGHDITVIDKDAAAIAELENLYDVLGIVGNGASYSVQMEAGIEKTDLLIAVTESDELNLLCCTVAKRVGDCAAIARVRTPDYSREVGYLRDRLGLAMIINPEMEAAREAARVLCLPTALEIDSFAHGQVEMIQFKIPEGNVLDGMTIAHLGQTITNDVLICAIERGGEVCIPSGSFRMQRGDVLSFISPRRTTRAFLEAVGFRTNRVKNAMIIGGGKCAYYLAHLLLHMGIEVKIIEINRARCEELSVLLPGAVIINGDGTDEELLREEGIQHTESFVALTGIDEENILLTLFAKQVSQAKVITKINRITFKDVISQLDLGSVVYPRFITAEAIIAYVRAKTNSTNSNVETLYHLFDARAEAIEFRIDSASAVTDTTLMELPIRKNLLVACINRGGRILIPTGRDCIRVGDTVMIVTTHRGLVDIRDILE